MDTLFTNVRILDGSGQNPYSGSVLVQGNRIRQVGRGTAAIAPADARVVDGAGATLMPGMCEAHTHFSWNNTSTLTAIQNMPLEEHVLWCAKVARQYLQAGFTSCVGAACAKPRLDVVIRNAIRSGQIPGPRYLAASQEITVPGGLGDETLPHLPFPEFSFGVNVNGADEMRKVVRMFLKYGVDAIKLNLSGDNFTPDSPANTTWMTDAEVATAMEEVRMRGKRGTAHARSAASVKQALRYGIQVIYHASFTDTETLDMLEAARDQVFVAPGLAILYAMLNEAEAYGITRAKATEMGYQIEWDAALESLSKMHKRGIRVLPGGDYGFAFTPHGQNARDLEFFVKYLGFTPMEAIRSATMYGGQIMMLGAELGLIREGYLADLLLVDGDPLANLSLLREPTRILAVMKDGVFAKRPEIASQRTWGARRLTATRRLLPWLLIGGPIAVFSVWALVDNTRLYLVTLLNSLTLASLYFIVASGFTLVFGLMRNVNLAHGSLYLLGGYIGYIVAGKTGYWVIGLACGFLAAALAGVLIQWLILRHMQGQDLRQTMVTIGLSIVIADVLLWIFTGQVYQLEPPAFLDGPIRDIPVIRAYSAYRLSLLAMGIGIGVLLWWLLNRTRVGMMIRAGVDDRGMLDAAGVNVNLVFAITFALGAGLAGLGGVIGAVELSIVPGEDIRLLLASLIVVIVGGMGSVVGAAIGAVILGLAETYGLAYAPTYSVVFTFLILIGVLAFKPRGIMGARA